MRCGLLVPCRPFPFEVTPPCVGTELTNKMVDDTQIALALAALGHAMRLKLWRLLLPHGAVGLPAGAIAIRLAIVPSSLSFHLRQMTQAGVLVQRRSSRHIIYSVNFEILPRLQTLFAGLSSSGSSPSESV